MGKVSLGLGLGVGYVLGTRAGRARYEQIKQAAQGFLERPEVQQTLEKARSAAPAPLQGSIDKLSGRGSGHQGTGTGDVETVDVEAIVLEEVDVVVPPPSSMSGAGDPIGADAPLPDPLIPPAKSGNGPGGRL